MRYKITLGLIFLPVLFVAAGLFWLNASARQPLDGDSVFFIPNAMYYAAGDGLRSPVREWVGGHPPPGDGRLIWHGFLAPMLIGSLAPTPDYPGVLATLAFLQALPVVVFGAAALRLLTPSCRGWRNALLLLGAAISLAAIVDDNSRPETVSILWVSIGMLIESFKEGTWRFAVQGALLAALACTSPISAVICGLAYLVYITGSVPRTEIKPRLMAGLTFGALGLLVLLNWYPYSIGELLSGLRKNSVVVTDYQGSRYLYYWFIDHPLLGLLVAIGMVRTVLLLTMQTDAWRRRGAFGMLLLVAAAVAYFAPDARNYNIFPLMPVVLLLFMDSVVDLERRYGEVPFCSGVIVLVVSGAFFLRMFAIGILTEPNVDRRALERALAELGGKGRVAVTPALLTGLARCANAEVINKLIASGCVLPTRPDWFVLQQINPWRERPLVISGYDLMENRFSNIRPTLMGFRLSNSLRDYSYALYKRHTN